MAIHFSIPGKSFLLGEYLALHGGPTLVALTQPCFEMSAYKKADSTEIGKVQGIHADSPAGKFISLHSDYFQKFDLDFKDPYLGEGGFGASTAQFLGVYSLWLYKEIHQHEMENIFDFKHILEVYTQVAWNGQGVPPSGADLIAQYKGTLTFFEKRRGFLSVANWPFLDLDFSLIHTGHKLATHEHLQNLNSFDSAVLEKCVTLAKEAFESRQSEGFISAVDSYAQELKNLGFTCEHTLKLLSEIRDLPGVQTAKGCGALGSDVLLVLTQKGQSAALKNYCIERKLSVIATQGDLSEGLQINLRESPCIQL